MTALLMLLLAAAAHGHVAPARPPFRVRKLVEAPDARISLRVNATVVPTAGGYVEVSWGGVPQPAAGDIVAMYAEDAPPNASYPIKFVWAAQASPAYLDAGSGSYAFQILNYKTAVAFYFLRSGFGPAAVAARTGPVTLSAPDVPVEVKLALTGLEERMLVSWATQSATDAPEVRWGTEPGQYQLSAPAAIRTYNASDLCQAPANSLGWKTPGALYSANLTGLQPATAYFYVVGSPAGGYSAETTFRTAPRPPAGDGDGATLQLLVVADMGQDNEDGALGWAYSVPSYDSDWEESMPAPGTLPAAVSEATWLGMGNQATEPDAMATIRALAREAATGSYNSLFHIGDISYARGMASQWDNYLQLMEPITSRMPYMVAAGNHEMMLRVPGTDPGGECGVPYSLRIPMPVASPAVPVPGQPCVCAWYSVEQGPIHFLVLSTDMDFQRGSPQWQFAQQDLAAVDRGRTPWLVVAFHRQMYTDSFFGVRADSHIVVMEELQAAFEEMFWLNSVDVVWQGHLHAYQRTCPAFNNTCIENAPDGSAQAPTYVTLGNAGFLLSPYQAPVKPAVFVKESMVIGWHRVTANATHFHEQALASRDGSLIDEFVLAKPAGWRPPSVAQRAAQLEGLPRQPPPPAGTDMAGWYVAYVKALPLLADLFKDKAAALLGPESVTWRLATGALPCCTMDVLFGSVAESAAFLNQTLGLVDDLAKLADRFNLTHNELYGLWEQYQAVTSYWLDGRIASFATEPTQPPGPNATDPIDAITS